MGQVPIARVSEKDVVEYVRGTDLPENACVRDMVVESMLSCGSPCSKTELDYEVSVRAFRCDPRVRRPETTAVALTPADAPATSKTIEADFYHAPSANLWE
jgi:hypothetical protein